MKLKQTTYWVYYNRRRWDGPYRTKREAVEARDEIVKQDEDEKKLFTLVRMKEEEIE